MVASHVGAPRARPKPTSIVVAVRRMAATMAAVTESVRSWGSAVIDGSWCAPKEMGRSLRAAARAQARQVGKGVVASVLA